MVEIRHDNSVLWTEGIHRWTTLSLRVNRRKTMRYTVEERMDIGRRVHEGELSRREAAKEYQISEFTVRDYLGMYRTTNNLPAKGNARKIYYKPVTSSAPTQMEDLEKMTKEELILELVKSRIAQVRLKKGYEVRGSGADKEFIRLDNKNTK